MIDMLPFDLASTSLQQAQTLKPGQFFFHRQMGATSLAVRLKQDMTWWLNLTGNRAFQLDALDHGRKAALLPGISVEQVRLRVDPCSAASNFTEHRIGQLLFDGEGKAGIAVTWGNRDPQEYKNVVLLQDWSQSSNEQPQCIFDRWALSVLDGSGQWVDLVRRESRAE